MNKEYQELLERLEYLENTLNPKPPELSEEDKLKAQFRAAYDNILDYVFNIDHSVKNLLDKTDLNPSQIQKERDNIKKYFDKLFFPDSENITPWEKMAGQESYQLILNSLSDFHMGSCTGDPFSCSRCQAEEYFNLTSTISWNKSDGHKMVSEYHDLRKKRQNIELANNLEKTLTKKYITLKNKKI